MPYKPSILIFRTNNVDTTANKLNMALKVI